MNKRKKTFIFGFFVIATIGILLTVYIIRFATKPGIKAAPTTVLSFLPDSQTVGVNQTASADIMVDPGSDQISTVTIVLSFDSSKISITPTDIAVNTSAFSEKLEAPTAGQCIGTTCTITFSSGIGSDVTKIITTKTKVATVTIHGVSLTNGTPTLVNFTDDSKVFSIGSAESAGDNVLSLKSPLTVTVGTGGGTGTITPSPTPTAGVCQQNTSTCQWDALAGAASYQVIVQDTTTGASQAGTVTAPQTSFSFSSTPGDTYTCSVTVTNACGQGQASTATNTCPLPTSTPIPSPTLTPSPTPTPAPTLTPSPTPTPTPTPTLTPTPTSIPPTLTPVPTTPPAPTNPPVIPPTNASPPPTNVIAQKPSLPPTGPKDNEIVNVGIVGVVAAIVGGLLLFGL